jgi:hypothetical protein
MMRLSTHTRMNCVLAICAVLACLLPSCGGGVDPHQHGASDINAGKLDNKILNMGPKGGLDADTVDGKQADAFAATDHKHAATDLAGLASAAIADEAGLNFKQSAESKPVNAVTPKFDTIQSVTIKTPGPGYVFVFARFFAKISVPPSAIFSMTAGIGTSAEGVKPDASADLSFDNPMSIKRSFRYPLSFSCVFKIDAAGEQTYYLNAAKRKEDVGVEARSAAIQALFFPTKYE